jgi:hypothetical protein
MLTTRGLGFAIIAVILLWDETGVSSHTGDFGTAGGTVRLCANSGTYLETPCSSEDLAVQANSDMTITLTSTTGELLPAAVTTFLPSAGLVPGPETNEQCNNSADDDGDTKVNDGCPQAGHQTESNRCDNALNEDSTDDGVYNDGCPVAGSSAETSIQCANYTNDDSWDDVKVNDGCFPGGAGQVEAETGPLCMNATNDDPRDDAVGGSQRVNDGCPAVGTAETACNDSIDDDADTTINDGCVIVGGTEAEVNECDNATDDDADGLVNDGCPEVGPLLGAVAGRLAVNPLTFGALNAPCNTSLSAPTYLFNSTTNNALYNEYGSGAMGSEGALGSFRDDGNGDGLPRHVDRYPTMLNVLFDPDRVGDLNSDGDHFDTVNEIAENPGADHLDWYGTVEPVRPLARYSGTTIVVGQAVLFQLMVFAPGTFGAFKAPHPLSDLSSPALGYPAVFILQDPTLPPGPEAITDGCAPSTTRILIWGKTRDNPCTGTTCPNDDSLGGDNTCINHFSQAGGPCPFVDSGIGSCSGTNEAGCVRYANPSTSGTHYFGVFQQSLRDADGDGVENPLDTCPFAVNVEDPRQSSGPDFDMLDSACDPTPTVNTNSGNHDGDTHASGGQWVNAADNCPLMANPDNKESERDQPHSVAAPRGGSRLDAMGDACELAETACGSAAVDEDGDGLVNDGCPTVGSATAESTCTYSTSAEVDNDLDGYPNDGCPAVGAAEAGIACENFVSEDDDNGDTVIDGNDSVNDGCPAQGGPEKGCLNSTDDDGDGSVNDGCPSSAKVATGHYHTVWKLIPKCIGGVDVDQDGYCTIGGTGVPDDPADNNAQRIPETYSQFRPFPVAHSGSGTNPPASREPLQVCNDGLDNDGDGLVDLLDGTSSGSATTDDCRPPDSIFTTGPDTDGDGSRDEVEIHVGTDPLSRCARGLEVGATPSIGWPMDLRGDSTITGDKINISDLGTFTSQGRDDTSPGDPNFDRRWDLRPGATVGNWINVADLSVITTNVPVPMFGVRAYGFFSVCSSHRVYGD